MKLIEPELASKLTIWAGWFFVLLGSLKVGIYLLGEFSPRLYGGIRSEGLRRFLTGTGNRLVFGAGGAVTILIGGIFVFLGYLVRFLADRAGL